MRFQIVRSLTLFIILIASACLPTRAASVNPASPSAIAETSSLLQDLTVGDYAAFVSNGTAPFKKLTRQEFNDASSMVAPHLKKGFSIAYMGEVRKQNIPITLWKIVPSQSGDDFLATLSMTNGHVAGFWIHQLSQEKIVGH